MSTRQVSTAGTLNVESAVRDRYERSARGGEAGANCSAKYDPRYLEAIPEVVLERDFGCGDPSRYVREGDTVLDLGSGGGKICFIASQIVGETGSIIGVDMNEEMLALARGAAPEVARRTGFANVVFRRGRIQDLRLDLDRLHAWLASNPVLGANELHALDAEADRIRREHPLVPDGSIDVVISNCVLNLVRDEDKSAMIREIFRVLKPGGRIAISDIVSDRDVPQDLKQDPELWSGCVSGAFREDRFLHELERAGFHGIAIDEWKAQPSRVVSGIEFRAVVVTAWKGKAGACLDEDHSLIYRGPWRKVEDDDGHMFRRGERTAVCERCFHLLTSEPYEGAFVPVEPRMADRPEATRPCDRARPARSEERETRGAACDRQAGEGAADGRPGACCSGA